MNGNNTLKILQTINGPDDIKALPESKLPELCTEIRQFLLEDVSQTGGHLASNLGVVELTVAIHRVFNTEYDRLVFDVGHQSYVHKILTGRRDSFNTLRQLNGISGFPKPEESIHDAFIAGHASNSVSVSLGIARARSLSKDDYNVIALIGDGAMTGGLSFEGLSDAGSSGEPIIIIINDNGMSITKNVGGFARYLANHRIKPSYYKTKNVYKRIMHSIPGGKYLYRFTSNIKNAIKKSVLPCSYFEELGFEYLGPVDGHDVHRLEENLKRAKELNAPVIVHAVTVKGKGYGYSESRPEKYHGVDSFDLEKGVLCSNKSSFSEHFGKALVKLADNDNRICAITAAMGPGTGLSDFAERFPNRYFDVGIAEGHAVSMAGGIASKGLIPVFAVYSTFLQRAFDMMIHDVSLMNLHVIFAVDRAGIVGGDGETHQGVFDIGFTSLIPNMTVLCPANYSELETMLEYAIYKVKGPVVVRYPRGSEGKYKDNSGIGHCIIEGTDITIMTYGTNIERVIEAANILKDRNINAEVIKLGCINPLDTGIIFDSVKKTGKLLIVEDCVQACSIGEKISAEISLNKIPIDSIVLKNLGNGFIPQGKAEEIYRLYGLDSMSIALAAETAVRNGDKPKEK